MSIRIPSAALAFALALPAAGATLPAADAVLAAELEAARGKDLYLVLDPSARTLDVKVRGMTLHTVLLLGVELQLYRPVRGAAASEAGAPAVLPAVLTVVEEPEDPHRQRIAPPELKPFPDENEEEGEGAEGEEGAADPAAPPEVLPDPPTGYRVRLAAQEDAGAGDADAPSAGPVGVDGAGANRAWELVVTQEPPGTGLASRLGRALADGWARLWRRPLARPHRLVLVVAEDDGRRLHHLFRLDTRILLGAGAT